MNTRRELPRRVAGSLAVLVALLLAFPLAAFVGPTAPAPNASADRQTVPIPPAPMPLERTAGPARILVSAPTAVPNPSDVGDNVTVNVTATGGIGPYTYLWTGLPPDCPSENNSSFTCAVSTPGHFNISATVSDGFLHSATSANETFVVMPRPTTRIVIDSLAHTAPDPVVFSLNISGGVPPFAAVWAFGDDSVGNGLSASHTYDSPGEFVASVAITDSLGSVGVAYAAIAVNASGAVPSTGDPPHAGPPVADVIAGAAGAVVVALALVFLVRRRRQKRAPVVPPVGAEFPRPSRNPYVPPPTAPKQPDSGSASRLHPLSRPSRKAAPSPGPERGDGTTRLD